MQIAITDRDRTPIWTVPGTSIHLSYENPGPIEVEVSTLTKDQAKTIWLAMRRTTIVGKNVEQLKALVESGATPNNVIPLRKYAQVDGDVYTAVQIKEVNVEKKAPVEEEEIIVSSMKQIDEVKEKVEEIKKTRKSKLASLLEKRIPTIKKGLGSLNITNLRNILELEKAGKNRPVVLTAINNLITQAQAEVARKVAVGDPAVTYQQKMPRESRMLTDIEDVADEEDITITLGDEETTEE